MYVVETLERCGDATIFNALCPFPKTSNHEYYLQLVKSPTMNNSWLLLGSGTESVAGRALKNVKPAPLSSPRPGAGTLQSVWYIDVTITATGVLFSGGRGTDVVLDLLEKAW